MESRRVRLRPPSRTLRDALYQGAMAGEFPWLWRNLPETPQHFDEALWSGVLAQFAIEDVRTGVQVGIVGAYGANHFHRYVYTTMTLLPDYKRRVWPFEGALLFGNLLFTKYCMENVYADTTATHYQEYGSGRGRFFDEVGRFPGRLLVNGQREDVIVTGMSRDQWLVRGRPLLERCTRTA